MLDNIWTGGERPVAPRRDVVVQFRDGRIKAVPAGQLHWFHDPNDNNNDIMRWSRNDDF